MVIQFYGLQTSCCVCPALMALAFDPWAKAKITMNSRSVVLFNLEEMGLAERHWQLGMPRYSLHCARSKTLRNHAASSGAGWSTERPDGDGTKLKKRRKRTRRKGGIGGGGRGERRKRRKMIKTDDEDGQEE